MTLCLHAGAEPVSFDDLRGFTTPPATATHVPIPHFRLVEMLKHSLTYYHHDIAEEHYGLTKDGDRFFGVMTLKSPHGEWTDVVGLRNSHDKSFPVGVSYGSRVFVCDNLAFAGDHVIRRKHTVKALRDIHALLAELIEPLALQREAQYRQLNVYKETPLDDKEAHHLAIQLYKDGVLNLQRLPSVVQSWDAPEFDWGPKTAWRFFNSVTHTLAGKVAEAPHLTKALHQTLDGVCQRIC